MYYDMQHTAYDEKDMTSSLWGHFWRSMICVKAKAKEKEWLAPFRN
jgi:hypothetical protein